MITIGCGCGGTPQVWQPASEAAEQAAQQQDANGVAAVPQAPQRTVWPKMHTSNARPEQQQ